MSGIFYGIGLGPGDPELITLKAHRIIVGVGVVAYPQVTSGESFTREIARNSISKDSIELPILVPMAVERGPAQVAYDAGATEIAKFLEDGIDVAYLCEGDPLFFGSFMYLQSRLQDRFEVKVVPGVTSISAASAELGRPLTARNETMAVLPGPLPDDLLRARISEVDAIAIMKVGRHLSRIRTVVEDLGLLECANYVERASQPEARSMPLAAAPDTAPYFSMILITQGSDPWL